MNFLRIYIILLINIFPIITKAGVIEDYSGRSNFCYLFDPSLVLDSESDYLMYYTKFHGHRMGDQRNWTDNLESWSVFFEDKYETSQLKSIIYRDKPFTTFLIELRKLREKKKKDINIDSKEESFIAYLKLALDVENVLYENYNSWDYYNRTDTIKVNNLVSVLQLSIKHEQFNFIKERYAYQLIKLLRYSKKYTEASDVYKNHFSYLGSNSFISYWAMDQYAGILRKLGDTTTSNYYFLKVIINSPSKRISAFSSYNVSSQKEFDLLEKMCRTNEEKIFLFFLRANNRKSLILYELDNINNITINERDDIILNDNIMKVLMTRQLNQIYPESTNTIEFKKYLEELILFNKKMTSLSTDDAFWELSLSYLYYLNNQIIESESTLNSINNLTGEQELQRDIIRDLNYLKSKQKFNDDDEDYLGSLLFKVSENINNESKILYDYYNNAQSHLYSILINDISKKSTKLFYNDVFKNSGSDLNPVNFLYYSDLKNINKLLSNIRNTQNSTLKEYVLQNNYENIILERKGTLLMRNLDSLEKAIDIFESIPDNFINNYHRFLVQSDPFIFNIKDCIDCIDNSRGIYWNKLTLSKELLKIRTEAYQNNNPENYFLLATAYYNMSYFGSSWNALSHYRTTTKIHGFYDMQIPINLCKKAIIFSNDDELIAKSLYMASKCEKQNFFIEKNKYSRDLRNEMNRAGYRTNFYKLQRYRHTRFFDEAFRECYDFSYYSNNY